MTYAGKLNAVDLERIIRPAYQDTRCNNYEDTQVMKALIYFITCHCKTERNPNPPMCSHMYSIKRSTKNSFIVKIKGNSSITYIFDVLTGRSYVAEHLPNDLDYSNSISVEFMIVKMLHNNYTLPVVLLV
jgi:hypothetical protein